MSHTTCCWCQNRSELLSELRGLWRIVAELERRLHELEARSPAAQPAAGGEQTS